MPTVSNFLLNKDILFSCPKDSARSCFAFFCNSFKFAIQLLAAHDNPNQKPNQEMINLLI